MQAGDCTSVDPVTALRSVPGFHLYPKIVMKQDTRNQKKRLNRYQAGMTNLIVSERVYKREGIIFSFPSLYSRVAEGLLYQKPVCPKAHPLRKTWQKEFPLRCRDCDHIE